MSEDNHVGALSFSEAEKRVDDCNGELYVAIGGLVVPVDDNDTFRDALRAIGMVTWILDDWRDIEIDRQTGHFNIFLNFEKDLDGMHGYYLTLLAEKFKELEILLGEESSRMLANSFGLGDPALINKYD